MREVALPNVSGASDTVHVSASDGSTGGGSAPAEPVTLGSVQGADPGEDVGAGGSAGIGGSGPASMPSPVFLVESSRKAPVSSKNH